MIPKVLAYITRESEQGWEVLVFRHIHSPEAGIQVPGGTVDDNESLLDAVRREVEEETGLSNLQIINLIATAPFYAAWRAEWQQRNIFHLQATQKLPDTWTHIVKAGTEDQGLHFQFSWLPLSVAVSELMWGQGQWLTQLEKQPNSPETTE